jgi:hypothetical protein
MDALVNMLTIIAEQPALESTIVNRGHVIWNEIATGLVTFIDCCPQHRFWVERNAAHWNCADRSCSSDVGRCAHQLPRYGPSPPRQPDRSPRYCCSSQCWHRVVGTTGALGETGLGKFERAGPHARRQIRLLRGVGGANFSHPYRIRTIKSRMRGGRARLTPRYSRQRSGAQLHEPGMRSQDREPFALRFAGITRLFT